MCVTTSSRKRTQTHSRGTKGGEIRLKIRIHFGDTWNWKGAPWAMAAMHATMDMRQMNVTNARKSISVSSILVVCLDGIIAVLCFEGKRWMGGRRGMVAFDELKVVTWDYERKRLGNAYL